MLVLGGAATVNALTGMNVYAAGFLIPIFVIPYTMAGGLKATFISSYFHTAIIFIILISFVFTVYVKKWVRLVPHKLSCVYQGRHIS